MLRRIDLKDQWRSLDQGFWASDTPFGQATVVYGHNGSGKSTLAELLLSLAEGKAATDVVWEHDDKSKVNVAPGGASPSPAMAVFTRQWVESNLSEFLQGENAEAIVTLGEKAIDAGNREKELEAEIARLRTEATRSSESHTKAKRKVDGLVRQVQDRIINELQRFDYSHYTRNRYTVLKVCTLLRRVQPDFPSTAAHAEALVRLGEPAPSPVSAVPNASPPLAEELEGLAALLERTPTRVAIEALEEDSRVQAWVEQGVTLHEQEDHCLFCAAELTTERREMLARHFDESWLRIRAQAQQALELVASNRVAAMNWLNRLPQASALAGDLQGAYALAYEDAKRKVEARVAGLDVIEGALRGKIADPSATPSPPSTDLVSTPISSTVLQEAVNEHNDQAQRHAELTAERKTTVFDHIVGSESQAFRDLETQAREAEASSGASSEAARLAEQTLERLRKEQFTTTGMADQLTNDLARVYGKNHLSISVTDDGRSYTCRRGDEAGTNLSEGERTTLSLLYFLRNLEDQQISGLDPADRIVVIDDPSSSLDREALFATHQWLVTALQAFGQYIVLTHDFSLLRLFIASHRSKWSNSAKVIGQGDADEIRFPRVAFREMFAATVDGKRTSKMGELPSLLRNSTTEYAYLFSMVMKGIGEPEDHERLFLLPNAARRVLEVFASYKAPHRPDFLQQLQSLVEAQPNEPFRAVYDFCNRFSHGEGQETVEVLDARSVHGEVRRCMEFLRSVDAEHFKNMCKAVKIDPSVLP